MPIGFERRDLTQDPLATITPQVNPVPLSPVKTPNPASFKDVGEGGRVLSQLLGDAGAVIGQYYDRRAKESEIEGKMAYYAGKTEQEIAASGNMYTIRGFTAVKTATAAEELKAASLAELEATDYQLTPDAYRAKQMQRFSTLLQESGDDPTVQSVLSSHADNIMPALAAQHAKLHNAWKMKETEDSEFAFIDSIANGVDPDDVKRQRLRERSEAGATGLPEVYEKALKTKALEYQLGTKKSKVYAEALATRPATADSLEKTPPTQFLQLVRKHESGDNYNVANGSRPVPFTTMTINQVLAWQDSDANTNGKATHAAGAYQFIRSTLDETRKSLGLSGDELFDEAMQDRLAMARMVTRGYGSPISEDTLINNLSNEWAALKGTQGAGAYDGLSGNVATVEPAQVRAALRGGLTAASLSDSLLHEHGLDPDDVARLVKSYNAVEKEEQDKFNAQRILHEKQIIDTARNLADLPSALKELQQIKEQYGYSDGWAESLAGRALSAVNQAEKDLEKESSIRTALSENALGTRTVDEQRKAMEIVRTEAAKQYNPDVHGNTDADKSKFIQEAVISAAVANNIVDPITKDTIATQLSGQLLSKDGKVKPEVLGAYMQVRELIKQGGEVYASQYFGKAAEVINTAIEFDDGNMDAANALVTAQDVIERERAGSSTPVELNPKQIGKAVDDLLDELDPSWLYYFSTKHATPAGFGGPLSPDTEFEEYRETFKDNPDNIERLHGLIKGYATRNVQAGQPEKSAIKSAMQEAARRAEIVGGSLLVSGPSSTIREDAGMKNDTSVNAFEAATFDYIKKIGPSEWGMDASGEWPIDRSFWNRVTNPLTSDAEARMENLIANAYYNPNTKTVNITLWADAARTKVTSPRAIPVSDIGDLWNSEEAITERSSAGVRKQIERASVATADWLQTHGQTFVSSMNMSSQYIGK